MTNVGEAVHDVWQWAWLEQLGAGRSPWTARARAKPGVRVAVVITLAMGIGAAAAVYSLSNAIHTPFPRLPQDELLWITLLQRVVRQSTAPQVSPRGARRARQTRAPVDDGDRRVGIGTRRSAPARGGASSYGATRYRRTPSR